MKPDENHTSDSEDEEEEQDELVRFEGKKAARQRFPPGSLAMVSLGAIQQYLQDNGNSAISATTHVTCSVVEVGMIWSTNPSNPQYANNGKIEYRVQLQGNNSAQSLKDPSKPIPVAEGDMQFIQNSSVYYTKQQQQQKPVKIRATIIGVHHRMPMMDAAPPPLAGVSIPPVFYSIQEDSEWRRIHHGILPDSLRLRGSKTVKKETDNVSSVTANANPALWVAAKEQESLKPTISKPAPAAEKENVQEVDKSVPSAFVSVPAVAAAASMPTNKTLNSENEKQAAAASLNLQQNSSSLAAKPKECHGTQKASGLENENSQDEPAPPQPEIARVAVPPAVLGGVEYSNSSIISDASSLTKDSEPGIANLFNNTGMPDIRKTREPKKHIRNDRPTIFRNVIFGKPHNIDLALKELRKYNRAHNLFWKKGLDPVIFKNCLWWQLDGTCNNKCTRGMYHHPLSPEVARALEQALWPVMSVRGPIYCHATARQLVDDMPARDLYGRDHTSGNSHVQPVEPKGPVPGYHQPKNHQSLDDDSGHGYYGPVDQGTSSMAPPAPKRRVSEDTSLSNLSTAENEESPTKRLKLDWHVEPSSSIQGSAASFAQQTVVLPVSLGVDFLVKSILGKDKQQALSLCNKYQCILDIEGSQESGQLDVKLQGLNLMQLFCCRGEIEHIVCQALPMELRGFFLVRFAELNGHCEMSAGIVRTRRPSFERVIPETGDITYMTIVNAGIYTDAQKKEIGLADAMNWQEQLESSFPSCRMELVDHYTQSSEHKWVPSHILITSDDIFHVLYFRQDLQNLAGFPSED